MNFLSPEILLIIFEYCSLLDLVKFKRINKLFLNLITENYQSNPFEITHDKKSRMILINIKQSEIILMNNPSYRLDKNFNNFIFDLNNRINELFLNYLSFPFSVYYRNKLISFNISVNIKDDIFRINIFDFVSTNIKIPIKRNRLELFKMFYWFTQNDYWIN